MVAGEAHIEDTKLKGGSQLREHLGERRACEPRSQELPGCVRRSMGTSEAAGWGGGGVGEVGGGGEEWQEMSEVRDREKGRSGGPCRPR